MKTSIRKIYFYTQLFILTAILAVAIFTFLFLKTYFYPAITGSETILGLQKNIAADAINLEQFNKLLENINEKTSPKTNEPLVGDPFK